MKIFKLVALSTIFFLLIPHLSLAQIPPPEEFPPPEIPTRLFGCLPTDSLRKCMLRILGDILRVIIVLALILSALMIAWAGVIYVTGGTDANKRKAAKDRLIYAGIGLVVAFLAWVLTVMFSKIIGGAAI